MATEGGVYLRTYLAPFAPWLERSDVTDILVNRPGEIWFETASGAMERAEAPQIDALMLRRLSQQIAAASHQGVSREHPLLAATSLLVVALAAAYTAYTVYVTKQADILFLVSAAFSFAAAGFFPALVLGIFWKRATSAGAVLGMIAGFGVTLYYMATNHAWMRTIFGVTQPVDLWYGVLPISAGLFGVPVGFAVIILVSLFTPAPKAEIQELIEHVRYPSIKGDINTQAT